MQVINFQIVVHSTDEIVDYLGRKADVEDLVNRLKVVGQVPAGLTLLSVGETAPEDTSLPFIQTDAAGNPLNLKLHNGADWAEMAPALAMKTLKRGYYVDFGSNYVTHRKLGDMWQDSIEQYVHEGVKSEFKFETPFRAGTEPKVIIVPKKSEVHKGIVNDIHHIFEWCLGKVTNTGFRVWTKHAESGVGTGQHDSPKNFEFDFIVIGEIEE